jgi:phosphatidylserine decarboxylase
MIGRSLFERTLIDKGVNPPKGNNIVSPACGNIINIIKISDKAELKIKKGILGLVKSTAKGVVKEGYLISIFMHLHDNHINRSPLDAKVVSVKHSKGSFRPAFSLKALQNEKTEIVLDSKIGKFKLIQIAGYIARRIETSVKPGDLVKKGQPVGLIKLGSQVTMILPSKVKLKVRRGQRLEAGHSIIGEF